MKIGDLVMVQYHNGEKHLGIIVKIEGDAYLGSELKVAWDDGDTSWILTRNVEVLDESR